MPDYYHCYICWISTSHHSTSKLLPQQIHSYQKKKSAIHMYFINKADSTRKLQFLFCASAGHNTNPQHYGIDPAIKLHWWYFATSIRMPFSTSEVQAGETAEPRGGKAGPWGNSSKVWPRLYGATHFCCSFTSQPGEMVRYQSHNLPFFSWYFDNATSLPYIGSVFSHFSPFAFPHSHKHQALSLP